MCNRAYKEKIREEKERAFAICVMLVLSGEVKPNIIKYIIPAENDLRCPTLYL